MSPQAKKGAGRRRPAQGGFSAFDNPTPPRSAAALAEEPAPPVPAPAAPAAAPMPSAAPSTAPAVREAGTTEVAPADAGAALARLAAQVPDPFVGDASTVTLTADEEELLARCEEALAKANLTFVVRGKALQTIRDGRLYKATHTTFDLYCQDRWELTARRVNQYIDAWRLGLRLGNMFPKLVNNRQVRELLPYAERNGDAAAVQVYEAVAAAAKPTATLLERVVAALPEVHDPEAVEGLVREAVASSSRMLPAGAAQRDDVLTAETRRLQSASSRIVASARRRPEAARQFAATLRGLADTVERAVPS